MGSGGIVDGFGGDITGIPDVDMGSCAIVEGFGGDITGIPDVGKGSGVIVDGFGGDITGIPDAAMGFCAIVEGFGCDITGVPVTDSGSGAIGDDVILDIGGDSDMGVIGISGPTNPCEYAGSRVVDTLPRFLFITGSTKDCCGMYVASAAPVKPDSPSMLIPPSISAAGGSANKLRSIVP